MHSNWKLSVFSGYMILYIEMLRNSHTHKKTINANKWDQQVCRTQDQYKIIVFLCTCNKQYKDKIKKIISERIKYLGTNLTIEVQDIHVEIQTLLKKLKNI